MNSINVIERKYLPTFLLLGAGKSGTTSVYHYLKQHPDIYMSLIKEPNYFAFKDYEKNEYSEEDALWIEKGRLRYHNYADLFIDGSEKIARGEGSGIYLFHPLAAQNIKECIPWVKMVTILRNPVDRAYSGYRMHFRRGTELRTFEQVVEEEFSLSDEYRSYLRGSYMKKGLYAQQLGRYISIFPKNQLKIILYDELCRNSLDVMRSIFEHIGVDNSFVPVVAKSHNVNPEPAIPLQVNLRHRLINYFSEDLNFLQKIIDQDLSHWR